MNDCPTTSKESDATVRPNPEMAIAMVERGIGLVAYKINDNGQKVPWQKGWASAASLPVQDAAAIMSCIESGCHGFQFRPADAGWLVVDIDMKGGKDGLVSLGGYPDSWLRTGFVVRTPNDGYHVYHKASESLPEASIDCLRGVDLLAGRKRLVVVPGSVAQDKSGAWKEYTYNGHLDNIAGIPAMVHSSISLAIREKKEAKEREQEERRSKLLNTVEYSGSTIFDEAKGRVTPRLIETLFSTDGAWWAVDDEYWTLNPYRNDTHIGSFSIRADGLWADMATGEHGDMIDLIGKTYNLQPLEAASMIIRETGGNPDDYAGKIIGSDVLDMDAILENIRMKAETMNDAPAPKKQRRFQLKKIGEYTLEEPEWLVDKLLETFGTGMIFGPPGSGKSFLSLDLSLCIATGHPFHGHEVKQGPVIYLAGEGHKGIVRRVRAWEANTGVSVDDAPFYLASSSFQLMAGDSVAEVINTIDETMDGVKPAMVVIDTLARNFGPGDENKTSDMGMAVSHIDLIRDRYQCTVMVVHHSGWNNDRMRGSTALKGATEWEYQITPHEGAGFDFTNTRMKDGSKPNPMSFKLQDIGLGLVMKNGEEMTSAYLERVETDLDLVNGKKKKSRGKNQEKLLFVLGELYAEKRRNLRSDFQPEENARVSKHELSLRMKADGITKETFYHLCKTMVDKGELVVSGNDVLLPDDYSL